MGFRNVVVGCAFAVSLVGCSDATSFDGAGFRAFDPVAGQYALISVDGSSVPTSAPPTLFTPDYQCARHITSGTLTITAQARYALEVSILELCTNGSAAELTRRDSGTYIPGDAGEILFQQDATSDWHGAALSARQGSDARTILAATSFGTDVRFTLTE